MTRNTPQRPYCPLLQTEEGFIYGGHCHIPSTRSIFLIQQSNGQCHSGKECLACKSLSEKAQQEVRVRAKLERRQPPARQRALEAVTRALRVFTAIYQDKLPENSSTN